MILLGEARGARACFCIADTLAGAAPFGEDLTVVVVGGGERQPVPYPLDWSRFGAKQPSPQPQRTPQATSRPDGLQCSAVVGVSQQW